jgi:hypothetical protein
VVIDLQMDADPRCPNLFLIGAMRSGTSGLHEQLARHPSIFMCEPKEPAFFADPAELDQDSPAAAQLGICGNTQRYLGLFDRAIGATVRGESSTHYSKRPILSGVVERIYDACPEARILYIMRDPVERSLSHYLWHVHRGYEGREVLEALQASEVYVSVSDYPMQIEPYLDRFGQDRVKLLTFEELVSNPNDVLSGVYAWLDLDPIVAGATLPARNALPEHVLVRRSSRAGPLVRRWMARAERRGWLGGFDTQLSATDVRTPEILSHLREILRPSVDRLSAMLERSFPLWSTTHGD